MFCRKTAPGSCSYPEHADEDARRHLQQCLFATGLLPDEAGLSWESGACKEIAGWRPGPAPGFTHTPMFTSSFPLRPLSQEYYGRQHAAGSVSSPSSFSLLQAAVPWPRQ